MNISVHRQPPITNIQDLSHNNVRIVTPTTPPCNSYKIVGTCSSARFNKTYCLVQIYIVLLLEAQMVSLWVKYCLRDVVNLYDITPFNRYS